MKGISAGWGLTRMAAARTVDRVAGMPKWSDTTQMRLSNARNRLLRQPGRTLAQDESGLWKTPGLLPGEFHYFGSINRQSLYDQGVAQRALSLARTYALDKVPFEPGNVVIDTGANYGDLFVWLRAKELGIQYLAVEPGRQEVDCLHRNVTPYGGNVADVAVGAVSGTATLWYEPDGANSSLEAPPDFLESYEVHVETLDHLAERYFPGMHPIRLLKLETEGTEIDVLRGSERVLPRIQFIAADLGFEKGTDAQSSLPDVVDYLYGHGFRIFHVGDAPSLRFLFRNENFKSTS